MLILRKLSLFGLLCFAFFSPIFLSAQDSTSHRFTHLAIEVRADADFFYDYGRQYLPNVVDNGTFYDTTRYGIHGSYFNIRLGGEFGKGFSYYLYQRVIANPGTSSLFDNTDFLYLQYKLKDRWAFRVGKEALAIGGYEYDAALVDVYFRSYFWDHIYCFQLAGSAMYLDKSGHNKLTLQISNSPYVYYTGTGKEWGQGLLGYSLMWNGNFTHFQSLYSINFFERERGKFVNYISLGNRLKFNWWSWYVDYQNRSFGLDKHFFDNFYVVSRMDFRVHSFNIFLKGGYEQNMADAATVLNPEIQVKDPLMEPGQRRVFYGIGMEFRPVRCPSVRIHANVSHVTYIPKYKYESTNGGSFNVNLGVTWKIDFLRYFPKLSK